MSKERSADQAPRRDGPVGGAVPFRGPHFDEIKVERQRQIEVEGWTPEHDDQHEYADLMTAAMTYLWHGTDKGAPLHDDGTPWGWPWDSRWWKPKDRRRNLIRAGALMLAEAERLRRKCPNRPVEHINHKLGIVIRELVAHDEAAA